MGRQRISAIDPVSGGIAICFAAGAAAYAPLAAQESRLVLAESGRHVLPAEVVVRGGALSRGGRPCSGTPTRYGSLVPVTPPSAPSVRRSSAPPWEPPL